MHIGGLFPLADLFVHLFVYSYDLFARCLRCIVNLAVDKRSKQFSRDRKNPLVTHIHCTMFLMWFISFVLKSFERTDCWVPSNFNGNVGSMYIYVNFDVVR